jgi:glutamyl-tRNA(Gln) amidotransferase subunit E
VKRGLGTIRQDVNISIAEGARVEIKGVQALDMIETIVAREAVRQVHLLDIRRELISRGAFVVDEIFDVTEVFRDTQSKVIKRALGKGKVYAVRLGGFAGMIGREVQPGRRLGTEFSDRAKTAGVGGIFHTDELPAYGITQAEVDALRKEVQAEEGDAVTLVADRQERAYGAMESVIQRAKEALEFVPEETRRALPDGNSAYMRPLPGASRMYPETDVPAIDISPEYYESVEVPELLTEKCGRFAIQFGLNAELAEKIVYSYYLPLFEELMEVFGNHATVTPTLICRTLTGLVPELRRDGVATDNLTDACFTEVFGAVAEGKAAKEGIGDILRLLAGNPDTGIDGVLEELGFAGTDVSQIEASAAKLVAEKEEFVREKGLAAVGPLMGILMAEFRGKADGKLISEVLKKQVELLLSD